MSHTIARLTVFTRAFYHTRLENLLKGPAHPAPRTSKFSSKSFLFSISPPIYLAILTLLLSTLVSSLLRSLYIVYHDCSIIGIGYSIRGIHFLNQ